MRKSRRTRAVLITAGLVLGAAGAAVAQGGGVNGHGGTGTTPPTHVPTVAKAKGPQPSPPPGAIAASQRRAEAVARGEDPPLAVWDPTTGDLAKNPDGSLLMSDRARFDEKTGELLHNPDGTPVRGEPKARNEPKCPPPGQCAR